MVKNIHEFRDPIHVFVRMNSHERSVVDSAPFQRLRHIHQLGLSSLVYPGATHTRFEHSLGVMELASRVFDIVTHDDALTDEIRGSLPQITRVDERNYWRSALRMAALCHDIGHLPFSHTAEDLLPPGWDHETLTREIILCDEMREIWQGVTPPLRANDIVKLALGPSKAKTVAGLQLSTWESILSEIIVGEAFGVDRMDYLLRDSHHAGVAYGRFDYYRLIDTLRILPSHLGTGEPGLGIEEGGIQSADALLLARYFMYSQVYFHPVRRIYDIHLKDFLRSWLPGGHFPTTVGEHLHLCDDEVTVAMREAHNDLKKPGHDSARRIVRRAHFKLLYRCHPDDIKKNPDAGAAVFEAVEKAFGSENVRFDKYREKGSGISDFTVRTKEGRNVSAFLESGILRNIPLLAIDYVFVNPDCLQDAMTWRNKNLSSIIESRRGGGAGE